MSRDEFSAFVSSLLKNGGSTYDLTAIAPVAPFLAASLKSPVPLDAHMMERRRTEQTNDRRSGSLKKRLGLACQGRIAELGFRRWRSTSEHLITGAESTFSRQMFHTPSFSPPDALADPCS
jgi:hypothetical protein